MSKLTIVANISAKSDCIEAVKNEILKLIAVTRSEPGCITYDLHQDNENPAIFMVYENWDSRDSWQAHTAATHLADFAKATEGTIESFTVHQMTHIA